MKFLINTLIFIFLFFLFKEITYYIFEIVEIDQNQSFIGEPKDMLLMQIGVFVFTIFMVFLFYFLETFFKKSFKNAILRKIIIFVFLLFIQIVVVSLTFYLKTQNVTYIYPKTFLITLGISALIIVALLLIVIIVFHLISLKMKLNEKLNLHTLRPSPANLLIC